MGRLSDDERNAALSLIMPAEKVVEKKEPVSDAPKAPSDVQEAVAGNPFDLLASTLEARKDLGKGESASKVPDSVRKELVEKVNVGLIDDLLNKFF